MSSRVTPEQKSELKSLGLWASFMKYRNELKGNGTSPADARRQALEKFLPDEVSEKSQPEPENEPDVLELVEGSLDEFFKRMAGLQPKPADVIQWVANNIDGSLDLENCPGLSAFTLLKDCRNFPDFRVEFWKNMWTKLIPSRATLDDNGRDDEIDGQLTIDFLKKIEAIGKKAQEGEV